MKSIHIGDEAPDFTAETTEGTVHFHEWIGDKWAVLFSHPKDLFAFFFLAIFANFSCFFTYISDF